MSVTIACCQIAPDVEDVERSVAMTQQAIRAAVADGAQIVVVPELATSGYVFRSREEARASALTPEELAALWAPEAERGDAVVIGGFCELAPDGSIFNSSALVDRDGVKAVYRKLHLWADESLWFTPGEAPAPVVSTRHGRIGLAVCYDLEFPEVTRGLALEGAELIAVPTNWPRDEFPPDGRPILQSLAAMTAYFSKVFVAVCDRCGIERGVAFEGVSVVAGPDGALRAGLVVDRGSTTRWAKCELAEARDKRTSERNDAFADRRSAHYASALVGG